MENLDYSKAAFSSKKIIPETGNELTFLWGRAIANNLLNTYGLTGTIDTSQFVYDASNNYRWQGFNLDLTRCFAYPPIVYFYMQSGTSLFRYTGDEFIRYEINGDQLMVGVYRSVTGNLYYRIVG
jgi:hypothetical protein